MIWLLLGLAFADDFVPETRNRVAPPYPRGAPFLLDVNCVADLTIGSNGRVLSVEIPSP